LWRASATDPTAGHLYDNVKGCPCLNIQGEAALGADLHVQRSARLGDTQLPPSGSIRVHLLPDDREQFSVTGVIEGNAHAEYGQSLSLTTKPYFKPALAPLSCAATGPSNTGCSGLKSDWSDQLGLMYSLGCSVSRWGGREQYIMKGTIADNACAGPRNTGCSDLKSDWSAVLFATSEAYSLSSSGGAGTSLCLVRVLCCVSVSLRTAAALHLVSRRKSARGVDHGGCWLC
jgi:hypothetical protein